MRGRRKTLSTIVEKMVFFNNSPQKTKIAEGFIKRKIPYQRVQRIQRVGIIVSVGE